MFFLFLENFTQTEQKANNIKPPMNNNTTQNQSIVSERPERNTDQIKKERIDSPPTNYGQSVRESQTIQDSKPWGYSGIDLMNTGAAFWQNYSGKYNVQIIFIVSDTNLSKLLNYMGYYIITQRQHFFLDEDIKSINNCIVFNGQSKQ